MFTYYLMEPIYIAKSQAYNRDSVQKWFLKAESIFKNASKGKMEGGGYQGASTAYANVFKNYHSLTNKQQQDFFTHWGACLYVLSKSDSSVLISNYVLKIPNLSPINLYEYYRRMGIIYAEKGKLNEGLTNLKKAEQLNKTNNLGQSKAEISLAFLYQQKGELDKALFYNLEAYRIAEKAKDTLVLTLSIANIAGIYDQNNELDKAEKEYIKAIELLKKAKISRGLAQCYQGLSVIYYKQRAFEKGIKTTLQEIEHDKKAQDDYNLAYAYYNLAVGYKELKQEHKIQKFIDRSLEKMLIACDEVDKVNLYLNIGEMQIDLKQYEKAKLLLIEALKIAQKSGFKKDEQKLYQLLAQIYASQNNFVQSNNYLYRYTNLKDSLQNTDKETTTQELLKKYELAEKEKELTEQKLKLTQQEYKTQRWIVTLILICLLFFGVFIYLRNQQQQRMSQAFSVIHDKVILLQNELTNSSETIKSTDNRLSNPVIQVVQTLTSLENQLLLKFKASNSFNYLISHELRQNLKQIEYSLQAFEQDTKADDKTAIQKSIKNITKLDDLVNRLLNLAKLENEPLLKVSCNLNDVVNEVIEELTIPKNCELTVLHLPTLQADVLLLKQVFGNLLHNAIKYASSKPVVRVTISSEKIDNTFIIKIIDNGIGFNNAYKDRLFQPFHRLHNNIEGVGIGLVVVKTIIEKHGGNTFAENNEQEGATFGFTLPAIS